MRLVALIGVFGISFSAIFVRLADVQPGTSAFFRCAYALPLLLLIRRMGPRDVKPHRRLMGMLTGSMLAADLFTWHVAISLIGAGPATVLANTQVLFVAVAAWVWLGERPTRLALATIPLVLGGIALMSGLGASSAYGTDPLLGSVLGTVCGITYAAFLYLFRAANPHRAPTAGLLFDASVGAALTLLVIGAVSGELDLRPAWPAHGWLLALAVVCQTASWLLISHAIPRMPVLETSVMLLLQPMLTSVWGLLLFDEVWSVLQATGAACVLSGVLALSLRGVVRGGHKRVTTPEHS